jgi:hypothetical protein
MTGPSRGSATFWNLYLSLLSALTSQSAWTRKMRNLERKHQWKKKLKRRRKSGDYRENGGLNIKQEVQRDLSVYEKLKKPEKDEAILKFWKENEAILPLLSKAARVTVFQFLRLVWNEP